MSQPLSFGGLRARLRRWRRAVPALVLGASLPGCGGSGVQGAGDFVESLVRLLSARFVPAGLTVPRGTVRPVDLEVVCDRAGLETPFGRLQLRVKLDPERRLPEGLRATLVNAGPPDGAGFALVPCVGAHPDPNLRIAHVAVEVLAATNIPLTSATVSAHVEIEPLVQSEPSKDSTRAELTVTVTG